MSRTGLLLSRRFRSGGAVVILYGVLCVVAAVQVLPLLWALATSLKPLDEAYDSPIVFTGTAPQWFNYVEVFSKLPFARFLLNSMVITAASVFGAVLTSSMAGYALARLPMRGKRFWFVLLIGSMMLPAQVLLLPHFLLFELLGWVGTYKPLIVPAWLGGGAFNVFLFRQYFKSIPRDVEEAALLDGATPWQCYRFVLLPMARPVVVTVAVLSFMFHWRSFLHPLLYLSDFRTFPVSLGIRMYQTMAGTWINLLMAASLISLVPVVIVFAAGQRYFGSGLILSSYRLPAGARIPSRT
ncbi:MAG: carbohydrate ABC transporter permease [Phycisphaerae bacterium]